MIAEKTLERFRIEPGTKVRLADHSTTWTTDELPDLGDDENLTKETAKAFLDRTRAELAEAQDVLWADNRYALLIVLQAMDAAGKDGAIKHVMSGLNPQGCQVVSFKHPSAEELDHDFLWRYARRLPERGQIGIFNRSHYEEVLIVRVHPELLEAQRVPSKKDGKQVWAKRYDAINGFEKHLVRSGTAVLKFFLHVSKEEQKRRFLQRLERPEKHWKFSARDIDERALWDDYMEAYERAISATSTRWAPWYVLPADQKWITRAILADVVTTTLQGLDLRYPELSKEQRESLDEARRKLEAE